MDQNEEIEGVEEFADGCGKSAVIALVVVLLILFLIIYL